MSDVPRSGGRLLDETADLQIRCALAVDARDWDVFAGCFAMDLTADMPRTGVHADRASMLAAVQATIARLDRTQHLLTNHTVQEVDGEIVAACYVLAQHVGRVGDAEVQFLFGGRYEDRMYRDAGSLKIRHRRLDVLWASGDRRVLD